jgi:hypothetical protein
MYIHTLSLSHTHSVDVDIPMEWVCTTSTHIYLGGYATDIIYDANYICHWSIAIDMQNIHTSAINI